MVQTLDVVITGVGVVSPIGIGKEAFWTSLRDSRSGVETIEILRDTPWPVKFGGEIKDFDGKKYVKPRKSLKVMARELRTGYAAASMAMEDARIDSADLTPERLGVVYGSDMLYCDVTELIEPFRVSTKDHKFHFENWGPHSIGELSPLWMLKYLPNMPACHVGIANDARGPNNTICQGEASSLLALIEAANVIRRGDADVMITGGASTRLSLTTVLFRGAVNLSLRNDAPAAASRPFDADRDGMVNGEGAAAMVLESRAHAEARGATILASLTGYGCTFAANFRGARTDDDPLARCMTNALEMADLKASDLGHVNAHGLSTKQHDRLEARSIRAALGDVPVTAPKSFFGNIGAAGGAVETIVSVLALGADEVPPTLNYDTADPDCELNVIAGRPLRAPQNAALLTNQSTTGQVASVVIVAPH